MARRVHFRIDHNHTGGISEPTACGAMAFNTLDTDLVTCTQCRFADIYLLTALRHREVVEALSSPKEEHPCLSNHQPWNPPH